ncbi:MAG TPA: metal ABC transporter ATP-binding protein [Ignavibacteria bacterium]|mgnify:CR=1 FL=1|nr:manganese ABC transporter ATP-binding protein [Bacteroidota bacterium]HRI86266.1 metal ABC transporter ATP-binding protein [Ignavibacteria bacterium]HRJ98386.1 metal ABC transporter ATP-binding protein [Ignavibacteria bacterium]
MTVITVKNLTISYNKKPAIKGINLEVDEGSIIGILGPNGAGKSTLIKGILGLLPSETGEIKIYGKPVKESLKRIAYIPQKEQFDWDFPINVSEVVMMGRYPYISLFGRPDENDKLIVKEVLEKVEMSDNQFTQIRNLSGGQQQRIFLARALAQESDIYLLDEPFVGVDAKTEKAIFELIKELKEKNKTILIVHHDLSKVKEYFDKVILINQTLVAFGDTDKAFTPELINKAYGGRLTILQKAEQLFKS